MFLIVSRYHSSLNVQNYEIFPFKTLTTVLSMGVTIYFKLHCTQLLNLSLSQQNYADVGMLILLIIILKSFLLNKLHCSV